jgi:hypothetical protein
MVERWATVNGESVVRPQRDHADDAAVAHVDVHRTPGGEVREPRDLFHLSLQCRWVTRQAGGQTADRPPST